MGINIRRLDSEICELLQLTAEESCEHRTVWMNVDAITVVVLGGFTRKKRKLVKTRLTRLQQKGVVESRVFDGHTGWKLVVESGGFVVDLRRGSNEKAAD